MRQPLAVAEQKVRPPGQFPQRGHRKGAFAEREQTGHVGEVDLAFNDGMAAEFERGEVEEHGGGAAILAGQADIDACNGADFAELVFGNYAVA